MAEQNVLNMVKTEAYEELKAGKERNKERKAAFSQRMSSLNAVPAWEAIEDYAGYAALAP